MSRWRLVLGWGFVSLLGVALAAVWIVGDGGDERQAMVGTALVEPPADPPTAPAEPPEPSLEPTAPEPIPTPGPATGDFAALASSAELTHPDTDPEISKWYARFGYYLPGEFQRPSGEWTNKGQLWDSLAPDFRQEALRLGDENHTPEWPGVTAIPASANVRWDNEDTMGRGEFVEFFADYVDAEGRQIERIWPVLIRTRTDGSGEISARMPPFNLVAADFANYQEQNEERGRREWAWVLSVPTG
jgi:hypothetical protein